MCIRGMCLHLMYSTSWHCRRLHSFLWTNSHILHTCTSTSMFKVCVFSNPRVQMQIFNLNVLPKLLNMLQSERGHNDVRSRCLFALSTLVRQFYAAQKSLESSGAVQVRYVSACASVKAKSQRASLYLWLSNLPD